MADEPITPEQVKQAIRDLFAKNDGGTLEEAGTVNMGLNLILDQLIDNAMRWEFLEMKCRYVAFQPNPERPEHHQLPMHPNFELMSYDMRHTVHRTMMRQKVDYLIQVLK